MAVYLKKKIRNNTNNNNTNKEKGYSLIMVVAVMALLTSLAMMVLEAVSSSTQSAGNQINSDSSLSLAESGAMNAQQQLMNHVYPNNVFDMTAYNNLKNVNAADSGVTSKNLSLLCSGLSNCPGVGSNWLVLIPTTTVMGTNIQGTYTAIVGCGTTCNSASPQFVIRSLGQSANLSRLIEVVLGT